MVTPPEALKISRCVLGVAGGLPRFTPEASRTIVPVTTGGNGF